MKKWGFYVILGALQFLSFKAIHAQSLWEPWKYSQDPAAQMWKRVIDGELKLDASSEKQFLISVLQALDIPIESQVLVFSKTSLQNNHIDPQHPRAIYYNEEVYVGWVQGGDLEIIAMDPERGAVFYTLSRPKAPSFQFEVQQLGTSDQCLSCHDGNRTQGIPGALVRSVYVSENGLPILRQGSFLTTDESPLSQRWGGWYVTGFHGEQEHMGNQIYREEDLNVSVAPTSRPHFNLESLEGHVDLHPYPASGSDVVSLMVLEHQCSVQNTLLAAAKSVQDALARDRSIQAAFGEMHEKPALRESTQKLIRFQSEAVLKKLFFQQEHPLESPGIKGNPAFQEAFLRNRQVDPSGRSLKDFHLMSRLFKYRCSYMIYSSSFTRMPDVLKDEVIERIKTGLDPESNDPLFHHLGTTEKRHLKTILEHTLLTPSP